ncbi:MAG: SulA-like leucine-rich domain-containing protein [Candidatus Competibacteraceae bacterium]
MLTIMSSQTKSRSVPNHALGIDRLTPDLAADHADWIRQGAVNTALIATPGEEAGVSDWLWPLLAERSQERRWIFWIAPAERPTLGLLCARGVDPNRVRLVHLAADSDPLPLVERALRAGTCSAVLAGRQRLSKRNGHVSAKRLAKTRRWPF